jgi:hypothetical protein
VSPATSAAITADYLAEVARAGRPADELIVAARERVNFALTSFTKECLSRPTFLDHATVSQLAHDLTVVNDTLAALPDRLFGGDLAAFARAAGLTDVQVGWVMRAGDQPLTRLCRADVFRDQDGFGILEVNFGSAVGGLDNAMLNRAFLTRPFLAEFVASRGLTFVDSMAVLARTIRAECGFPDDSTPVVAATDWPASFVTLEPVLHYSGAELARYGIDFRPCHLGQLELRQGKVWLHDSPVDVIFRIFLIEDLLDPDGPRLIEPVLRAAERGEVKIFTPMSQYAYSSKAALAMLSDEVNRSRFTQAELTSLDRVLPWTRMVRPGPVTVAGERVDLAEYAAAEREDLLIKPTSLHGGIGVVHGWLTDQDEWAKKLAAAMDGPFVLQRRIRPVPELFPSPAGLVPHVLCWGVFCGVDGYGGMIVRGSSNPDVPVMVMSKPGVHGTCCFHAEPA